MKIDGLTHGQVNSGNTTARRGRVWMPGVRQDFARIAEWAKWHLRVLLAVYAPGTKLNGNGRGRCPVHGGDGQNFTIENGKGWYCHSVCGTGGDGVDLVRRLTGRPDGTTERVEVLRELAPLAGVSLNDSPPRPPRPVLRAPRPQENPAPPVDTLEALRADGMSPANATSVHTTTIRDVLTLGPRGAAYLERRGFDAREASSYGFRSLEDRAGWDALEHGLAANFLPDERNAAGVGTLPAGMGAALVLPYRTNAGFCGWRLRSLDDNASWRYRSLKEYSLPLPFNAPALSGSAGEEVHVLEGELNAYTLSRYGLRAIGLAGAGIWRPEWTDALQPAARVIAWYDDDQAGMKGWSAFTDSLAEKIGRTWTMQRVRRVKIAKRDGVKDANDLHVGGRLAALVEAAPWRTR